MAKRRGDPESVGGVFRQILEKNPKLLNKKKNAEILAEYRRVMGMPADAEIEKRIVANLANVKSTMRKKIRGRGRKAQAAEAGTTTTLRRPRDLESLEILIDDAMAMARAVDKEQLHDVWRHLRAARNKVVLMMG